MKKISLILMGLLLCSALCFGQSTPLENLDFLLGEWSGSGVGFGNEKSNIESQFQLTMEGKYIEVRNESWFEPTEKNPEGGHHLDKGFISYDQARKTIVFRQFNNEGYINQYVLNDSLSNESLLVFETEIIENFVPGGKARWSIKKTSESEIETIFEVSFPDKEYACFGTNNLKKQPE